MSRAILACFIALNLHNSRGKLCHFLSILYYVKYNILKILVIDEPLCKTTFPFLSQKTKHRWKTHRLRTFQLDNLDSDNFKIPYRFHISRYYKISYRYRIWSVINIEKRAKYQCEKHHRHLQTRVGRYHEEWLCLIVVLSSYLSEHNS